MSKRMQVLVDEAEYAQLRRAAENSGMSLAEWVRQALRKACRREPEYDTEKKLAAIRAAVGHDYPTGDIDAVLAEIERGYVAD